MSATTGTQDTDTSKAGGAGDKGGGDAGGDAKKTSMLGDTGAAGGDAGGKEGEKKDQGQAGGDKGAEGAGEIKLTLPEGMTIDAEQQAAFVAFAKEQKLSSEQASAIAAYDFQRQKLFAEAQVKADDERSAKWEKEIRDDKELGGKNLDATLVSARRALTKFGGAALSKELTELGLDNHPGLVRAFAAVGKAMAEDTSGSEGGSKSTGPKTETERLRSLYPKSSAVQKTA